MIQKPSIAVLVDDLVSWQAAGRQPTGIERVVSELLETAYQRDDVRVWPAVSVGGLETGDGVQLVEIPRERLSWRGTPIERESIRDRALSSARSGVVKLPLPRRLRALAKGVYGRLAAPDPRPTLARSAERVDVLLVPGVFWTGDLPQRIKQLAEPATPVRVVVYDLFPLTNPEWFEPQVSMDFRKAFDTVIPISDRIVTLSRSSADRLIERYPPVAERVRVAVPTLKAHSPRRQDAVGIAPLTGPFLLALGTVEPRKNHRGLLEAWRLAREDHRLAGAWLVIAGRRGWRADDIEDEIARDAERLQVLRLDHATDQEIEALYAGSLATLLASWGEGFGLPARESIVRGVPTIISSAVPRDGLPSGSYRTFDPGDARRLAELIVDAVVNPGARMTIELGDGTGWEPVLSALLDS